LPLPSSKGAANGQGKPLSLRELLPAASSAPQ
jgi:hypothetical protein